MPSHSSQAPYGELNENNLGSISSIVKPLSGQENLDENVILSIFLNFFGSVSFSYSTTRRPSDKFKSPYPNVNASTAANGGAYPPDMSVLVKARPGGSNYIYSVLVGYDDPPQGMVLDDGVYYNKYMTGKKIKMSSPLSDDIVEYGDGTSATVDQMAKDVTTFLTWAAEPELEERHRTGVKVIIYLILLTTLVYLSMKKIWSRVDTEV